MRLARVLIPDTKAPRIALERDGALYDVEALEAQWDTRFAPERFPAASDFFTRAVALRGLGLDELDARLMQGERPAVARLRPGEFVSLSPCDPRGALVTLEPTEGYAPSYRIGLARALAGNTATVSMCERENSPEARLDVFALLGEDLSRASPSEAKAAIIGYALANAWTSSDELARAVRAGASTAAAHAAAKQMGPTLVTTDEAVELKDRRATLRVDGRAVFQGALGFDVEAFAAGIAAVSRVIDLAAGDVIAAGLRGPRAVVAFGASVELVVEQLGKLTGSAARR